MLTSGYPMLTSELKARLERALGLPPIEIGVCNGFVPQPQSPGTLWVRAGD